MALDRHPATLCGNAHCLVIVTDRTAARERITQPEIPFERYGVGGIGKGCRALVCGNHEIRVVAVMDHNVYRMDNLVIDDVVSDREQGANKYLIAFGALCKPGVAVYAHVGQAFGVEAAFRPGRHNHRVLDALRLHQTEHFGAEIVAPV